MAAHIPASRIRVKRAYDPPARADGRRLLVDRLWPRGVRKNAAALDDWLRDVAPSSALRAWFDHDPTRWDEFRRRYAEELRKQRPLLQQLRRLARQAPITLVYGARDESHNNAVALRRILLGR
jgi:uncharacterized protein YeaO (DUF488 family)